LHIIFFYEDLTRSLLFFSISATSVINNFVENSINYLSNLSVEIVKKVNGQQERFKISILESQRRTVYNGLIICLTSIKNLFTDLILNDQLDFLLTYKMSQDHLEMFFSAIRAKGGFTNNPTATQFEAAYKRLIVHSEVMVASEGANCIAQDVTNILTVSSGRKKIEKNYLDMLCVEEDDELLNDNASGDIILNYSMDIRVEERFTSDIISYIAGYISRKILRTIKCKHCSLECIDSNKDVWSTTLLGIKNKGGLTRPSTDIISLCKAAETVFNTYKFHLKLYNPLEYLIIKTCSNINIHNYFKNFSSHILSQSPLKNHLLQLHHYNKVLSQPQDRIRSHFTKLIHFRHQ
ncbi:Transposable element P transposase, partial [Aphis craccivora]